MKLILFLLLLAATQQLSAQAVEPKDSLVNVICRSVSQLEDMDDTTALWGTVSEHLHPYFSKMEEATQKEAWMYINLRLQRNCKKYNDFMLRHYVEKDKTDWKILEKMPELKMTKSECRDILKQRSLQYLEGNGDSVQVEIANGFWIDHFKDGTYSKLKFRWMTDCEFEIEFVQSNNDSRRNLSKPGDKYRYTLVEKKAHYYDVLVEVVGSGSNDIVLFKMYY